MMTAENLCKLEGIEKVEMAGMEAEIRVAPSEEVKAWIAEERAKVGEDASPGMSLKNKPDWNDDTTFDWKGRLKRPTDMSVI